MLHLGRGGSGVTSNVSPGYRDFAMDVIFGDAKSRHDWHISRIGGPCNCPPLSGAGLNLRLLGSGEGGA